MIGIYGLLIGSFVNIEDNVAINICVLTTEWTSSIISIQQKLTNSFIKQDINFLYFIRKRKEARQPTSPHNI